MDYLDRPFTTQVRLRVNPEILATVRWYFAHPGAKVLPVSHAFGARCWETNSREYPTSDIGQVDLVFTPDRGAAPPGKLGQGTETPLEWFRSGVPATVVDPYPNGICGLPPGPALWLRPEELLALEDYSGEQQGEELDKWPHAPTTTRDGLADPTMSEPIFWHDGPTGWPGAVLHDAYPGASNRRHLLLSAALALPGDYTVYLVGRFGYEAGSGQFDLLGGGVSPLAVSRVVSSSGFALENVSPTLSLGSLHFWRGKRSGETNTVWRDGADRAIASDSVIDHGIDRIRGAASIANTANSQLVLEVIAWPRALLPAEDDAVIAYLQAKYQEYPDMNVAGTIIAYGGVSAPAGYLTCDGAAVSRTTYAALYAAIGTTWGVGDGSTTFDLPDLRGRSPLGAGSGPGLAPRAVADTGGAETHVLTEAEMPTHTHPPLTAGAFFALFPVGPGTLGSPGPVLTAADATTGPTGGGAAHPNMHPWRGVLFAIKY